MFLPSLRSRLGRSSVLEGKLHGVKKCHIVSCRYIVCRSVVTPFVIMHDRRSPWQCTHSQEILRILTSGTCLSVRVSPGVGRTCKEKQRKLSRLPGRISRKHGHYRLGFGKYPKLDPGHAKYWSLELRQGFKGTNSYHQALQKRHICLNSLVPPQADSNPSLTTFLQNENKHKTDIQNWSTNCNRS